MIYSQTACASSGHSLGRKDLDINVYGKPNGFSWSSIVVVECSVVLHDSVDTSTFSSKTRPCSSPTVFQRSHLP